MISAARLRGVLSAVVFLVSCPPFFGPSRLRV